VLQNGGGVNQINLSPGEGKENLSGGDKVKKGDSILPRVRGQYQPSSWTRYKGSPTLKSKKIKA